MVDDLSVSSDLYHYDEALSQYAKHASAAAKQLGIPLGFISIAQPSATEREASVGQIPEGESAIMYRGRAAEKLAPDAQHVSWETFTACPYEDLRDPGRLHVDPFGYMHICQGISLGNIFTDDLADICERYNPETHPITGPLLTGGPAELVRRHKLPLQSTYADACLLCYQARLHLRSQFSQILTPDQVYGILD